MTQRWLPDTCNCIIYMDKNWKYEKSDEERHCIGHTKQKQFWLDEVLKHNQDFNVSVYPKGSEPETRNGRTVINAKFIKFINDKQKMKMDSMK